MKTKIKKPNKEVSVKKKELLKELVNLIDKNRTIIISSALNIPSSLFQKIRKNLREKAIIKIVKKNLGVRALEDNKKPKIKEMQKYVEASTAFIFSSLDPYELAALFAENKQPTFAKAGQISPIDITIEKGPTDLPAGPAISELSAVGLKVGVEGGKITIKETKTLVKKGEVISKNVADVLQKLEIMPFTIEISVLAAYDSNDNKIYTNIIIDKEGFLNKLKECYFSAFNFAVNIGYASKETINTILEKAEREALTIQNLLSKTQ
ncbi:MAG: 50S ribosomal protein L10 [Candidatus Pacearchaeota archaeon]